MEYPLFSRNVTVGSTGQEPKPINESSSRRCDIHETVDRISSTMPRLFNAEADVSMAQGRHSLASLVVYLEVGVGLGLGGGLKVR